MIKNIEDIRDAASTAIKDVVGRYIHLKKQGVNWTASCPFHGEKTPSFSVSPSKGIFKCFGCGAGGDAIHFVMEHENMTFVEAAETVAAITNTTVEYAAGAQKAEVIERERERKQLKEAQRLVLEKILEAWRSFKMPDEVSLGYALHWYCDRESRGVAYLATINGRQYHPEALKKFKLAYASSRLSINDVAEGLNLDKAIIGQLGLVKEGEYGTYDFFRDRIIYPIHDHSGKLRGFAGRVIRSNEQKKTAKFINSPESASYNKSELLYGLHLAKRALREENEALIVEGYDDTISLHTYGFTTAVAPCGTSITQDQVRLLKRFTKKAVLLLDGDKAGKAAAVRGVEMLMDGGVMPKVCLLPDQEDPDSYLKKFGAETFQSYLDTHTKDGLIWRIMLEWNEDDEFSKTECYRLAGELLLKIKDNLLRDEYIRTLCKKANMGAVSKRLHAAIKDLEVKQLERRGRKLNSTQTHNSIHYGIYVDHKKYYEAGKNSTELTNFHINPVMLIRGKEQSTRLVEVVNEFDASFITSVESKVMTQFGLFKIFLEENGTFMFNEHAKENHWIRIRRMLYERMPTVYPIYTMGLHQGGFFTWGNGITDQDGKFWPVNEYGVVTVNDVNYFIQAGAEINTEILSDESEDELEDQRNLAYVSGPGCPTMKEWSELFVKTHGERNGVIAAAWAIANFYRDIVHPKFKSFPHLNGYGPPRSGKSFLGWSLQYLYGATPKGMTNVMSDTVPSLPRAVAWCRGYIAWYDEYKNEASQDRVEVLKAIYDGKGRGKAKGGYGHGMVKTPVNCGAYISGQEPLTKDNALMTRSICLKIENKERSNEKIKAATTLREIEQSGILTQQTSRLMKYRSVVKAEWFEEFDGIRSQLRQYFQMEDIKVDDRMIMNSALVLAIFAKVARFEEFSFTYLELQEHLMEVMKEQISDMVEEDEVGIFWQIIDFLITDGRIRHEKDIKVEMSMKERFYLKGGKSDPQQWTEPKKLIYLNFARMHGLYLEYHKRQRGSEGQPLPSLKDYMSSSAGFLGVVQKKFSGRNQRVVVFDVEELAIDFQLTAEAIRPNPDA